MAGQSRDQVMDKIRNHKHYESTKSTNVRYDL